MASVSAFTQIAKFLNYLTEKPQFQEILDHLSLNASPDLEICGVGISILEDSGLLETLCRSGIKNDFPSLNGLSTDARHTIAESFREQKTTIVSFKEVKPNHDELLIEQISYGYSSAITAPLSDKYVIGMLLHMDYDDVLEYQIYFETLFAALEMYLAMQSKKFLDPFKLNSAMTPRQVQIHDLIIEGKTNREISEILSYSVSLVRQETMRIYEKLGVNGRTQLRRLERSKLVNQ